VPVLQPERIDEAALHEILSLRPELLVWAAYGNRIPSALLGAVNGRAVNVHASLLPRWRGAAPIAHAILAGDRETGVTLMEGTAALDEGPILAEDRTPIGEAESAGDLTRRLALLGAALLERELPRYIAGELRGTPQDTSQATLAPKLESRDGELDFARPAEELARRVRAFTPEPGAWTTFRGERLVVAGASVSGGTPNEHGALELHHGLPEVATGAGWLRLEIVRPAGKRTMTGEDWARGLRGIVGARLPS
jgi:methionyl-tRNA formyltransferase